MMSVNQMAVYHSLLESYNIVKNSASEEIQFKWKNVSEKKYSLRSVTNNDLKVPEKPMSKNCGFTYFGAKLFNMLHRNIKESDNSKIAYT